MRPERRDGGATECLAMIAWILWCSVAAVGQSGQQPPTYRGRTDLLTISVTAVDRDGHPVKGLVAGDFDVEINGAKRPVRVVDFLEQRTAPDPSHATTIERPQVRTGDSEAPPRRRVVMVLFDDLSFSPGAGKELLVALERSLTRLGPDDFVGVTTTSGLGPVLLPTVDRSRVNATLHDRRLVGRDMSRQGTLSRFVSTKEALEISQSTRDVLRWVIQRECEGGARGSQCADQIAAIARAVAVEAIRRAPMQLEAYSRVVEALRQVPAPRILIWLTAGIAIGAERDAQQQLEPLTRAAANAGVRLYALVDSEDGLDMRDVGMPSPLIPSEYSHNGARRANSRFLTAGMQTLATAVGGTAFSVVGQADRFLSRAFDETSSAYRLGVELPDRSATGQQFKVRVTTKRRGVVVRTAQYASQ
jgi:VWFA-related protein